MYTRRDFIKASGLASTATLMPAFLSKLDHKNHIGSAKKLIIIQLSGGNDGLNTCIPFRNDNYYRSRPQLGIGKGEVLALNDEMGLNPAMSAFRELYDKGQVSILNSVGYPNPDRSHFRSMDIWHTASNSDEYWDHGWLGRYLDSACSGCASPHKVVEVDDTLSLANKGTRTKGLAMRDPDRLYKATQDPYLQALNNGAGNISEDNDLDFLYKTMTETIQSAAYLHSKVQKYKSRIKYPATKFGREIKLIAELIGSGVETDVFYLSLTGFDTHVRQRGQHDRLLKQYSEGVSALVRDLKQIGVFRDTLIMTFSEFGRRVEENASGGTDHGKANNLFLIGDRLKRTGVINENPDLSQLDDGDLKYKLDFRNVYADVLKNWLEADDTNILKRSFNPVGLL